MKRNRSGRGYDREFKNNAVALVRGGRTITEVARDLGVWKWSLGHWVRRAEEGQRLSEPKTLALETARATRTARLAAGTGVCEARARHFISEPVNGFFAKGEKIFGPKDSVVKQTVPRPRWYWVQTHLA